MRCRRYAFLSSTNVNVLTCGLAAITLLIVCVYYPSLHGYFLWDDYLHLQAVQSLSPTNFWKRYVIENSDATQMLFWWTPQFRIEYFRPITTLSIYFDHLLWGLDPFGYHLTNLMIHLLTTFGVVFIARRIIESQRLVILIGFLFGFHPAHSEAINWISGRVDLLVTCFAVFSFLSFQICHENDRSRGVFYVMSLCSYTLALLSKESGLITFVLLIIYDLYSLGGNVSAVKHFLNTRLKFHLPYWGIGIGYWLLRTSLIQSDFQLPAPYFYAPSHPDFVYRLITNIIHYTSNLFFLYPTSVFDLQRLADEPFLYVILGSADCIAISLTVYFIRKTQTSYFFLLWTILPLLPLLSIRYCQRLLYLPSVGFCVILGMAIHTFYHRLSPTQYLRRRGRKAIAFGMVILYMSVSFIANTVFKDFSSLSKRLIQYVQNQLDDLPQNHINPLKLYFIDTNMSASMALTSAFRLFLNRPAIVAKELTVAPRLLPPHATYNDDTPRGLRLITRLLPYWGDTFKSRIEFIDKYTLKISLDKGVYLKRSNAQLQLFSAMQLKQGDIVFGKHFNVLISRLDSNGVKELIFSFKKPLESPDQLFFQVDGLQIRRLTIHTNMK